jgi:DNA-directed RNA polymerase subunit D
VEIDVLKKEEMKTRLVVKGVDVPFMNALRRTILTEVPTMAIDEVVIIENSSVLQDEVLAHRLGLTPLKTDLDSYNLPEECSCESEFGCNLCRVSLTLDAEAKEGTRIVYSRELISDNLDVTPVSSEIPLAKLAKEQRIRLEAYARLGKGKNHAKWQPTTRCTYKYLPRIEINDEQCDKCGECVKICPKKVFSKSGEKIEIRDFMACTLCQDCVDVCPKDPPAVKIGWKDDSFIFNIESTGVLPPKRIMIEAVKILDEKLKQFIDEVKVKKIE